MLWLVAGWTTHFKFVRQFFLPFLPRFEIKIQSDILWNHHQTGSVHGTPRQKADWNQRIVQVLVKGGR